MEGIQMISRIELQILANREKVALGILEKDYILTEVLNALSQVPELQDLLVFKGGTALRKIYFPDWRYSEDLDFTVKKDMKEDELRNLLNQWYRFVQELSQIQLTIKMLHKPNGYARIRSQYLGPLAYPSMIFMDLSFDEPLCLEPELKKVITEPFSDSAGMVLVYPLEELLAEKMRSLVERGKSRDYYDVWRLLNEQSSKLDMKLLGIVLKKKLAHKGITLDNIDNFLPVDTGSLRRYWEQDLAQQITKLPPLDQVLDELKILLNQLIASNL
jgi:predicted nucleotidyltransferase component of viral defense system